MIEESRLNPIEIPLGESGMYAWIDQEDEDLLREDWQALSSGTEQFPHYYAYYRINIEGKSQTYYLHNEVWEKMTGMAVPKGYLIDHINGDKLDNRRCNLRLANRTLNEANKRKRRTQKNQKDGQPTSSYKGVSFMADKKRTKPWRAVIQAEGKYINLGCYETPEEAALAYNEAAKEKFGEFALLNRIYKKRKKKNG